MCLFFIYFDLLIYSLYFKSFFYKEKALHLFLSCDSVLFLFRIFWKQSPRLPEIRDYDVHYEQSTCFGGNFTIIGIQ